MVKYAAVNDLANVLEMFTAKMESRGTKVFFASDASGRANILLMSSNRRERRMLSKVRR